MTTEVDPYELVRVLQEMQQRLEHAQEDIDNLFGVFHSFSEVATEHLGAARESKLPGQPTIYF